MSVRHDMYRGDVYFPRSSPGARRQNNETTVRCLLEEAVEGTFLGREFWREIEREASESLPGWEVKWIPIR